MLASVRAFTRFTASRVRCVVDRENAGGLAAAMCPNLGLRTNRDTTGEDRDQPDEGRMPGDGDDYLTMQEAAKMLKIGVRTLYRYLDDGRISRSYRLPGKRLVAREDVMAFMDQCVDERLA